MVQTQVRIHKQTMALILQMLLRTTSTVIHKTETGAIRHRQLCRHSRTDEDSGIGSYYAKSITRYREQLGGFASINQLKEIDGLPEEALSFIKITPGEVKVEYRFSLPLRQLRRHPTSTSTKRKKFATIDD